MQSLYNKINILHQQDKCPAAVVAITVLISASALRMEAPGVY